LRAVSRVLVVEDNQAFAETLKDVLENSGFAVSVATNGPAAVAKASEIVPDTVLLDLVLPGMTGIETLRQIKSSNGAATFIVVSAYTDSPQVDLAIGEGAVAVFPKPCDVGQLLKVLAELREHGPEMPRPVI
jgi:CheY-like chemotaxis protein